MSEESGNTQDKKNKKGSMTTSFMANSLILTSVMYIGILGLIYHIQNNVIRKSQFEFQKLVSQKEGGVGFIAKHVYVQQINATLKQYESQLLDIQHRINDQSKKVYGYDKRDFTIFYEVKKDQYTQNDDSDFGQFMKDYYQNEQVSFKISSVNFDNVGTRNLSQEGQQFIRITNSLDQNLVDLFNYTDIASHFKRIVMMYVNEDSYDMITRVYPGQQNYLENYYEFINDKDNDYNVMKRLAKGNNHTIDWQNNQMTINGPLKINRSIEFNSTDDYETVITVNMHLIMNDKFRGVIQFHIDPDLFFSKHFTHMDQIFRSKISMVVNLETEGILVHSLSRNMIHDVDKAQKYYDMRQISGFGRNITGFLKNYSTDFNLNVTSMLNQYGENKTYYWSKCRIQNYAIISYVEQDEVKYIKDNQDIMFYGISNMVYTYSMILIQIGWSIQFYFAYLGTRTIQRPLKKILDASDSFSSQQIQNEEDNEKNIQKLFAYKSNNELINNLLKVVKQIIEIAANRNENQKTQIHRQIVNYGINQFHKDHISCMPQDQLIDWDQYRQKAKNVQTQYEFLGDDEISD